MESASNVKSPGWGAIAFATLTARFTLVIFLPGLFLYFSACTKITAPADIFPPATPANFSLLGGGDGEVHFRWSTNIEPDFDKYRIYRSFPGSNDYIPLVDLRQTEYVDRFLEYETVYYYYITAFDFAGNESDPSPIIDVQPLNISSPPSPENLLVTGSNNPNLNRRIMDLSWTPPNVSDVVLFKIYRDTTADFTPDPARLLSLSFNSSFQDLNVQPGERFFYKVISEDRGSKLSAPSAPDGDVMLREVKLQTPANQTIFASPFTFTWETVDKAVNYRVFVGRGPFSDVIWQSGLTTATQAPYGGPSFQANRIYYWWVGAYSKEKVVLPGGLEVAPEVNSYSIVGRFFVE